MTRTLLIISLAATAVAGSALADAPSRVGNGLSVKVSLTGKDAKTIKSDIRAAAAKVCAGDTGGGALLSFENRFACEREAEDRAMAQLARLKTPSSFDQARAEIAPAR